MLAAGTACTLLVEPDRAQCAKNEDCAGHGLSAQAVCVAKVCTEPAPISGADGGDAGVDSGPEDPIWGCLGKVPQPPVEEPTVPSQQRLRLSGTINGNPLVGLPVKACLVSDPFCTQPYAGTPKETNDAGIIDVTLYSGFRGYFDFTSTEKFADLMPSLYYVLPVPDKDKPLAVDQSSGLGLLTKAEFEFATSSVGKQSKPEYGHLIFGIVNCQYALTADAIVRAEPVSNDTFTFYTDSAGTPSLTQAKTSTNGNGGFVNLPSGKITMTVNRESGQRIGSREVLIRPGTITYLIFSPTP